MESFLPAPFMTTLIEVFKTVKPACAIHNVKPLTMYCTICELEGCNACWQ